MKTFNRPEEMDALHDSAVVLLETGDVTGLAAQKLDGLWFVAGADPHEGRTAAAIATRASRYGLTFRGVILWEPE